MILKRMVLRYFNCAQTPLQMTARTRRKMARSELLLKALYHKRFVTSRAFPELRPLSTAWTLSFLRKWPAYWPARAGHEIPSSYWVAFPILTPSIHGLEMCTLYTETPERAFWEPARNETGFWEACSGDGVFRTQHQIWPGEGSTI